MSSHTDSLDLGSLALSAGEGRHLELTIALPPLEFGGQTYTPEPAAVAARLDVSRTLGGGYSLRLRYAVTLDGPCMRCLDEATPRFTVDAREVHQPGGGEDLESPYLDQQHLDVRGWARDSLALELPAQILCTPECRGICGICGENLNKAGADHEHERPRDSRFAKLSELRFD